MGDSETQEARELLEINPVKQYPSCLLIKKRPLDSDPAARAAEFKKLKQCGNDIMDRVKQFIPTMKESERLLQERIRSGGESGDLDIEQVDEGQTAVEIDLALFEYNSDSEQQNAEADVTENSNSDSSDLSDEEDQGLITEIPDPPN